MSKRYIFPEQYSDSKKAKLNLAISDHNFPLSQNPAFSKVEKKQADSWGDDNDDEILLLASQACEQVLENDISLPDYSLCMQPASTSTQLEAPSTSKNDFAFKKPVLNLPSTDTTQLRENYNRISLPLPSLLNVEPATNDKVNINEDLILNDKIFKDQDSMYRQLLQLQEENVKLKSENGKLAEKCVTKGGEVSILRSQLKACQVNVDNARFERIRAQEKAQMEWLEKLTAAGNEIRDLRTQLDFKNLEIISIKEKCKMLESSKIKLTQVNIPSNDISISHHHNKQRRPSEKITSCGVQTESKLNLLKLNKTYRSESSNLSDILHHVLEPTSAECSILEYNGKLQKPVDRSHTKRRMLSSFYRVINTPVYMEAPKTTISIESVRKDFSILASNKGGVDIVFDNILNATEKKLGEVEKELLEVCKRTTNSYRKEMDERYIKEMAGFFVVQEEDLICGKSLYKNEQGLVARRLVAILARIVSSYKYQKYLRRFLQNEESERHDSFIPISLRICKRLDEGSCAVLYSGLILSIIILNYVVIMNVSCENFKMKLMDILKTVITSRPMPFVFCYLLKSMKEMALCGKLFGKFCSRNVLSNLKTDHDQGVVLYKKDTCLLQVLLKQTEATLKSMGKGLFVHQSLEITQDLLSLRNNLDKHMSIADKPKCDCQPALIQVIVYALRICIGLLKNIKLSNIDVTEHINIPELISACRSGIQIVHQFWLRDGELISHLRYNEGHFIEFVEAMKKLEHGELHRYMIGDLAGTFHSTAEETAVALSRDSWVKSFQTFSIAD